MHASNAHCLRARLPSPHGLHSTLAYLLWCEMYAVAKLATKRKINMYMMTNKKS